MKESVGDKRAPPQQQRFLRKKLFQSPGAEKFIYFIFSNKKYEFANARKVCNYFDVCFTTTE